MVLAAGSSTMALYLTIVAFLKSINSWFHSKRMKPTPYFVDCRTKFSNIMTTFLQSFLCLARPCILIYAEDTSAPAAAFLWLSLVLGSIHRRSKENTRIPRIIFTIIVCPVLFYVLPSNNQWWCINLNRPYLHATITRLPFPNNRWHFYYMVHHGDVRYP
jgi:hypothetical protein